MRDGSQKESQWERIREKGSARIAKAMHDE